ncbi:MAG: DUF6502 family protein [Variovorax sp.]
MTWLLQVDLDGRQAMAVSASLQICEKFPLIRFSYMGSFMPVGQFRQCVRLSQRTCRNAMNLPTPPSSASHAGGSVSALALAACARLLRPVLRLALSMGMKHADLRQLLVTLLVEEGQRTWRAQGVEPNISQLSVTTGLNRKAITGRQRTLVAAAPGAAISAASRTLTRWARMVETDPGSFSLPIVGAEGGRSFEAIAREASRGDLHHRAILDELVRLDLVEQRDGQAVLTSKGFVPRGDLGAMLSVFADNAHDHLAAGVHNVLRAGAPRLERSIYATGVRPDDCADIERLVRQRWTAFQHELADRMTSAVDAAGPAATARIRVGIYTYTGHVDDDIEGRRNDAPTLERPEHRGPP